MKHLSPTCTQSQAPPAFAPRIGSLLGRLAVFAAAMLLGRTDALASHAMGGELTYTCLGNYQWQVTLNFYRDCNGVSAPTSCTGGAQFNAYSASCGANFWTCLGTPTVEVITPLCDSEPDRCETSSGTYGVEKYTYTGILDLSNYSTCGANDWIISWSHCCRNNAITSLVSPGSYNLYLETELSTSGGLCNNSPSFTNSPTPFFCLGDAVSYNPGAVDVDGDSLAYALIAARSDAGINIPYNVGYSSSQPILNTGGANAVTLNPLTGTMTVTPSQLQSAVVTYKVLEYRNGNLIGSIIRDVQFVVRACTGNSSPMISGINGTSDHSMQVCAGTPISFFVNSSDPNTGQTVTMTWNSGIPGATFAASGTPWPTGTFTWTPTVADLGSNTFTVHVEDDGCPLKGVNDVGFSIQVMPPVTAADAGPDQTLCVIPGIAASATLAANAAVPPATGSWSVTAGTAVFADASSPTTTVSGLSDGDNILTWSLDNGICGVSSDDMTITVHTVGMPCDDGDPGTTGETWDPNCNCTGTGTGIDCEGVVGGTALPGTACDDGDECTTGDVYDPDCVCIGTLLDSDGDGVCDKNDLCPNGPEPGSTCDDGDATTENDMVNADCVCVGEPKDPCDKKKYTQINITMTFGATGGDNWWELYKGDGVTLVASGGPFPNAMPGDVVTETICVPDACYRFYMHSQSGNGMGTGGYTVTDGQGQRIIDANGNFTYTSYMNARFCLPVGPVMIDPSSCDITGMTAQDVIMLIPVAGATKYQFWVFDPHTPFRIKVTRTNPQLGPFNPMNFPAGLDLNVRARAMVNGAYTPWGPACRLSTAPIQPKLLADGMQDTRLEAWPNPNDGDHLRINFSGFSTHTSVVEVTLHDATGRQVQSVAVPAANGVMSTDLDLSGTVNGVYLLRANANGEVRDTRIMVVK